MQKQGQRRGAVQRLRASTGGVPKSHVGALLQRVKKAVAQCQDAFSKLSQAAQAEAENKMSSADIRANKAFKAKLVTWKVKRCRSGCHNCNRLICDACQAKGAHKDFCGSVKPSGGLRA